ncbi:lipocalin-like domain-containing protein [Bacillus thuringiensis]|uniref:lipocalin-like domain-containing protein n=1 Tax=Bacillus thuringiensis TaxID=1428 RepID=UPI000E4E808F|nr:lipocalin-like domain-containing protein [Bacillus thuringiensis]MDZ3952311.1 lipocalin-like domain-containing protein [Bacillus thuringiensis]RGP42308.1 hypothetical protein BTW32_31455 [Bacillus thuringiensis]
MSVINKFVGTWELRDFYIQTDNATKEYPLGKDVKGLIMYSDKYVSVCIKGEKSNDQQLSNYFINKLSKIDKILGNTNYIAYCGMFDVNSEQKIIIHKVQVIALDVAQSIQFSRYYTFVKDQLILTTAPVERDNILPENTPILVWKKIS